MELLATAAPSQIQTHAISSMSSAAAHLTAAFVAGPPPAAPRQTRGRSLRHAHSSRVARRPQRVAASVQDDEAAATTTTTAAAAAAAANTSRAKVLVEALPYIQKFAGKTFVIKYGGAAMKSKELQEMVIGDLVFLACVGVRPVFVHGGGPEVNSWLGKVGIEAKFINGLRVTDQETMDIAEMVLAGRVNKNLVALINTRGGKAVGLCGKDGNMVSAEIRDEALGFVGDVTNVNPDLLNVLSSAGYIPVVSSIGTDAEGNSYNINADTLAGELASALKAEKLILLTDVPGVMGDPEDMDSLYRSLTVRETTQLIGEGVISGGMVPKIGCCINALSSGVHTTHIVDGRLPHSILLEIFTETGTGTMVNH